ncbi:hypothetical protein [Clostridium tertium]|uniref:hypothetical protein n=1 Tax=Clostridium tertium TaxID=1559 RepID=UPI0024B3B66E|nr:hypothetical protein [Clostridium tertium]MDI9215998.1 hypothetical protein [Clostridium tertium]
MREKLRKDLSDDRILSKCDGGIHYIHKAENMKFKNTYIEYEIIEHTGSQYFGDIRSVDEYIIQIDVFSKGSFVEISETILNVMEEKGYLFINGYDAYEDETGLYSYKVKFRYYKRR